MVTHNPLHGSGHAGLPHPALALGDNAEPHEGIGMADANRRKPAIDQAGHALPGQSVLLAATQECAPPESSDRHTEGAQSRAIHGHAIVADVSCDDRAHVLSRSNADCRRRSGPREPWPLAVA